MVLVVEMSTGQMVEDVQLALDGRVDVEFYGRAGGNVPTAEEVCKAMYERMGMMVEWGV
jgi:pyruvate/2-oxoacid:ferredoxin oxidoreductase alpha subunit